jgi:hypothetical protein
MISRSQSRRIYRVFVSCSLAMALGCNSQQSGSDGTTGVPRIKGLTALYISFMNNNAGRPPASEDEFKRYVAEKGGPVFDSAGVSTAEEMFISPRDNEPYVILYGNDAAKLLSRGIVAHERTGVNGSRLVGRRAGSIEDLGEAEFRKLVPAS